MYHKGYLYWSKYFSSAFLCSKGHYPAYEQCPIEEGKKIRLPIVDLPISIDEIIKDLEAIIITHTHIDHWDDYTAKFIPKYIPIFVQMLLIKN